MTWLIYLPGILFVVIVGLAVWRALDHRADQVAWERLAAWPAGQTRTFDAAMTAGLPEPAQRYFNFTIAHGTRLVTAVEVDMAGEIGLGSKDAPGYRPMEARQILSPHAGFVWRLSSGIEVDFIVGPANAAIEAKGKQRITSADLRGLLNFKKDFMHLLRRFFLQGNQLLSTHPASHKKPLLPYKPSVPPCSLYW